MPRIKQKNNRTDVRKSMTHQPTKDDVSVIFSTHLGWWVVAWVADAVRQVVFGYARKQDVVAILQAPSLEAELSARQLELVSRLKRFAGGEPVDFADVSIDLSGQTPFQRAVLRHCRRLKWGTTATYAQLARRAGRPGAARAVGSTMARNPVPVIVPCHRVVRSGGRDVGGFSAPGGNGLKQRMLAQEGALFT